MGDNWVGRLIEGENIRKEENQRKKRAKVELRKLKRT